MPYLNIHVSAVQVNRLIVIWDTIINRIQIHNVEFFVYKLYCEAWLLHFFIEKIIHFLKYDMSPWEEILHEYITFNHQRIFNDKAKQYNKKHFLKCEKSSKKDIARFHDVQLVVVTITKAFSVINLNNTIKKH